MNNTMNLKTFDTYVYQGKATWWNMELPSGTVTFGKAKAEMLGYSEQDFSHYKDFTNLLHPKDYDEAMKAMKEHLDGSKEYYETVYRIKHKDGHYLTFYDFGRITKRNTFGIKIIGYVLQLQNADDVEIMSGFRDLILASKPDIDELLKHIRSVKK